MTDTSDSSLLLPNLTKSPAPSPTFLLRPMSSTALLRTTSTDPRIQQRSAHNETDGASDSDDEDYEGLLRKHHAREDVKVEKPPYATNTRNTMFDSRDKFKH